jgi:hypothetical protein
VKGKEIIIGPSNGYFYFTFSPPVKSWTEQGKLIYLAGGNCLEFALGREQLSVNHERMLALINSPAGSAGFQPRYFSVHLPLYNNCGSSDLIFSSLEKINKFKPIDCVTMHPSLDCPEEFFAAASEKAIPLALENIDKPSGLACSLGYQVEELSELIERFDLGFIFDIQHAYEHDPSMNYARKLFFALQDRIRHYHLSGQNPADCHSLVQKANNREAVLKFIRWAYQQKRAPIILEGTFSDAEELKREISLVKRKL